MKKNNIWACILTLSAIILAGFAFMRIESDWSVLSNNPTVDVEIYDCVVIISLVFAVALATLAAILINRNTCKMLIEPFLAFFTVSSIQYFPDSFAMRVLNESTYDSHSFIVPSVVAFAIIIGYEGALFCVLKGIKENSIIGRLVFRGYQNNSIRWQLRKCVIFAFILTFFVEAIIAIAWYLFQKETTPWMHLGIGLSFAGPIMMAALILGLFSKKSSVGGDIEMTVIGSLEKTREAEREKVELISNMSHDLKTPITALIGYSEQLCEMEELPEKAQHKAQKILEKSDHLNELICELFELTKITESSQTIDLRNVDIGLMLQQLLAEYEEDFQRLGLMVETHLSEKKYDAWCDNTYVYRVLKNLIENILKYAATETTVVIGIEDFSDKFVQIYMKNQANYEMDFSPEQIVKRFERGSQSRTGEGNGLGLAIAKAYAEACGGELGIEVYENTFKATFCLKKAT